METSENCSITCLLSTAQPFSKLLSETSSLLHFVPRLPSHKAHRFSLYLHNHGTSALATCVQAILGVIQEHLDFLRFKVPLLCLYIRHHFLRDLLALLITCG